MQSHPNLLIVAGTGRNSGKTTLACNIISRFKDHKLVGVKISPHFHEANGSLQLILNKKECRVYRETSSLGDKDSSKMLAAGASEVFYIQVYDHNLCVAYIFVSEFIGSDRIMVAESPALRNCVKPGVFIIMDNPESKNKKDLGKLPSLADAVIKTSLCSEGLPGLNYSFKDGWQL